MESRCMIRKRFIHIDHAGSIHSGLFTRNELTFVQFGGPEPLTDRCPRLDPLIVQTHRIHDVISCNMAQWRYSRDSYPTLCVDPKSGYKIVQVVIHRGSNRNERTSTWVGAC